MALLIFDLDGTLVDSVHGLAAAMNKVLEEMSYEPHSISTYKSFVGNGIKMLVQRALPKEAKEELESAFTRMVHHYDYCYTVDLEPYKGIYELLDYCVSKGNQLALVTNKSQEIATSIMADFFPKYPWKAVIGECEDYPNKPNPLMINRLIKENNVNKSQVYMIGDTEVDLLTARNAGINEVFVSWGFRKQEELRELVPKNTIHEPHELIDIIAHTERGLL